MIIFPALIGLAATGVAAGASLLGQRKANRQNRAMAREQMAFQERLSSTAYQRSMKDMRAAGLNPMLAFQQGGASSPGGAQARMESETETAVTSAKGNLRLASELKSLKSTRYLQENQAMLARNAAAREAAVTSKTFLESDLVEIQKQILQLQMPALQNSAKVEVSPVGKNAAFVERLRQAIMGGRGFFNPIGG